MKMHRPGRTKTYVLEQDRDSEHPTEFTLRGLTWKELDEVNKHSTMSIADAIAIRTITQSAAEEGRELTDEEREKINSIAALDKEASHKLNVQHATACGFGIVSVGKLFDKDGEFEMKPDEFIEAAPPFVLHELGGEIISMSRYSEDEAKN